MPSADRTNRIQGEAEFDPTGTYRYRLSRCWGGNGGELVVVMLNPSRADASRNDPTLRRCLGLAQGWGYSRLITVNLFAYRTPYPQELLLVSDPVGPANDTYLLAAAAQADTLLLAWGNGGRLRQRAAQVKQLLAAHRHQWRCLGINQTGQPRHPLYVRRDCQLQPWPKDCPQDTVS